MDLLIERIDAVRQRRVLAEACQVAGIDLGWLCEPFGMVADVTSLLESAEVSAGFVITSPALPRFDELIADFDR